MADPDRFGYRRLDVYQLAHGLGVRIHAMTRKLPSFERFEEGAQVRRSSKSVSALIVEGYALRKHRDEFLHYLHRALASSDETKEHLDYLHETGSLKSSSIYSGLAADCEKLSAKIGRFIIGVERGHSIPYYLREVAKPKRMSLQPGIQNRESKNENR